jgi:prepilin peptidase CpaA
LDPSAVGLVFLVAVAAAFDVGTHRIPNYVTVTGVLVALGLRGAGSGAMLLAGLAGALMAFAVSFSIYILGGLGGGDVKLLTAVGAFLGPRRLVTALLATALVGGIMALVQIIRRRALKRTIAGVGGLIRGFWLRWFSGGSIQATPTLDTPGAITVPYGLAIAIGAVAGLLS